MSLSGKFVKPPYLSCSFFHIPPLPSLPNFLSKSSLNVASAGTKCIPIPLLGLVKDSFFPEPCQVRPLCTPAPPARTPTVSNTSSSGSWHDLRAASNKRSLLSLFEKNWMADHDRKSAHLCDP